MHAGLEDDEDDQDLDENYINSLKQVRPLELRNTIICVNGFNRNNCLVFMSFIGVLKEVQKLRMEAGGREEAAEAEVEEAEDDDTSNTRDYKAPIDSNVDEYMLFQDVLTGMCLFYWLVVAFLAVLFLPSHRCFVWLTALALSTGYAGIYHTVTEALTQDEQAVLQTVLLQADQRKAVVQSTQIAAQGGYSFAQTTVPTTFNFGSR
jgi:hypothetical protein